MPLLGCIADDYTGATDLCSMLVRAGLRVIQCFGVPEDSGLEGLEDADAVVVALKSRSIAADDAVAQSLDALQFLQAWGADRFFFKYCSTFDSTPAGNIGPVADALADSLQTDRVLFCPAFPENGRTVHGGHLFVDGVPLNESGMRNHPLNPMTDSSLVNVLQVQSGCRVSWMDAEGQSADAAAPFQIVDAQTDAELQAVARRAQQDVLLTGGSAIARYWVDTAGIRRSGAWPASSDDAEQGSSSTVILAGSCSEATQAQIAEFDAAHPVLFLNVATSNDPREIAAEVLNWCDERWAEQEGPLLIASAADPDAVAAARTTWGELEAAELVERVFAEVAIALQGRGIRRLIVAGGETSGAVINALQVKAIRVGDEIAPGVPWVRTLDEPQLSLALKSGNFGGPRFFADALEAAV